MILKMKFIVPIALVASGIATFGLYSYLQKQRGQTVDTRFRYRNVVVANVHLPIGKKLVASDIKISEWPEALVPAGSFSNVPEIVGRVVRTEAQSGEVLFEAKLAPKGSEGGFSSIIPPGMRALTVSVNNSSGVGGFILPNTRVDVLVTVSSPIQKEESMTKIILEDIKVLAIDQTFQKKEDDPVIVQTVTLLVTPEEAEKLALASTEGKLLLSLRNTTDRSIKTTPGVQLKDLILKQNNTPVQKVNRNAGSAPGIRQSEIGQRKKVIEVIRSTQRVEVTFENGERK